MTCWRSSAGRDLRYMKGMWHAARGLAYAAGKRLSEAEKERTALAALKDHPELEKLYVSSVNTGASVLDIAYELLSGELASRQRRVADAIGHFDRAVALEDSLTYMEPPDWPIPVRQLQGAALLELGRAKEAEAAFRGRHEEVPDKVVAVGFAGQLERQGARATQLPCRRVSISVARGRHHGRAARPQSFLQKPEVRIRKTQGSISWIKGRGLA